MPHYYSTKNSLYGKITVIPKGLLRRINFRGYSPIPYVVDAEIEFTLQVDKLEQPRYGISNYPRVYQRVGNGMYKELSQVGRTITQIKGRADYTGDTKFFLAIDHLGTNGILIEQQGILLFSDDVKSLSSYIFGLGGIIFTAIIAPLIVGFCLWLLNFFQIIPFYKIWITR